MNVRFLILLPSDPLLATLALQLTDRIRRGYRNVWIGVLAPEAIRWVVTGFPPANEQYFYKKTPGEFRQDIREQLPDYLIDLSTSSRFWLFKNNMRIADFTLSYKRFRTVRQAESLERMGELFQQTCEELLSPFELAPFRRIGWKDPLYKTLISKRLPDSYQSGYVVSFMEGMKWELEPTQERVINLLSLLDYPVVLIGEARHREIGDELSQAVGCTVFNTAGDFTLEESRSFCSGSRMIAGSVKEHEYLAYFMAKRYFDWNLCWSAEGDILVDLQRIKKSLSDA